MNNLHPATCLAVNRTSASGAANDMTTKEANTEWTEKLKSLLLEQTKAHFGDKQPTPTEFSEFLEEYAYYAGKNASFIEDMYKLYLDRINRTAEELQNRIKPD